MPLDMLHAKEKIAKKDIEFYLFNTVGQSAGHPTDPQEKAAWLEDETKQAQDLEKLIIRYREIEMEAALRLNKAKLALTNARIADNLDSIAKHGILMREDLLYWLSEHTKAIFIHGFHPGIGADAGLSAMASLIVDRIPHGSNICALHMTGDENKNPDEDSEVSENTPLRFKPRPLYSFASYTEPTPEIPEIIANLIELTQKNDFVERLLIIFLDTDEPEAALLIKYYDGTLRFAAYWAENHRPTLNEKDILPPDLIEDKP